MPDTLLCHATEGGLIMNLPKDAAVTLIRNCVVTRGKADLLRKVEIDTILHEFALGFHAVNLPVHSRCPLGSGLLHVPFAVLERLGSWLIYTVCCSTVVEPAGWKEHSISVDELHVPPHNSSMKFVESFWNRDSVTICEGAQHTSSSHDNHNNWKNASQYICFVFAEWSKCPSKCGLL